MKPSRKHPSAAFWATVALVTVLVAYPLSFGPACWISSRIQPDGEFVSAVYHPLIRIWQNAPAPVERAITSFVMFGVSGNLVQIPFRTNNIRFFPD
jgi:hypothetical protein